MCAQIAPTNSPENNEEVQISEIVPWPLSRPAIFSILGIVLIEGFLLAFFGYDDLPRNLMLSLIPGWKSRYMCSTGLVMLTSGLALKSVFGDILAISGEIVLVITAIEWALILLGL